eukprot:g30864.t1
MEANCGFLHRLDVPCSGLVMVAKSYEAYYDLLLQMNSGQTRGSLRAARADEDQGFGALQEERGGRELPHRTFLHRYFLELAALECTRHSVRAALPDDLAKVGVLDPRTVNVLVTTTVLSMSLTPLLATFSDVGARRLRERRGLKTVEGTDEIGAGCLNRLSKDDRGFVVICGYNVVGRTICRLLDSEGEAQYVVFEDDVKTAQEVLSGLLALPAYAPNPEALPCVNVTRSNFNPDCLPQVLRSGSQSVRGFGIEVDGDFG